MPSPAGVDPPDVIKISPCARLECWVDPLSMQAPKALDTIGEGGCNVDLMAKLGGNERWVRGHAGAQGAGHDRCGLVDCLLRPILWQSWMEAGQACGLPRRCTPSVPVSKNARSGGQLWVGTAVCMAACAYNSQHLCSHGRPVPNHPLAAVVCPHLQARTCRRCTSGGLPSAPHIFSFPACYVQARTCRRSTSGGSRGPSTRCTWTPRLKT